MTTDTMMQAFEAWDEAGSYSDWRAFDALTKNEQFFLCWQAATLAERERAASAQALADLAVEGQQWDAQQAAEIAELKARHSGELLAAQITIDRLRAGQGEPVAKVFTRRCFHEYEGSEKEDTVGYLVHDYFWLKRADIEGTTYLYTASPAPAHTEAEVQEIFQACYSPSISLVETVRRILGVEVP